MHYTLGLCYTYAAYWWLVHTHWHVSNQYCVLQPQVRRNISVHLMNRRAAGRYEYYQPFFKQHFILHTFYRVLDPHTQQTYSSPLSPSAAPFFSSPVTVKQEAVSMATRVIKRTWCAFIHGDKKKHADTGKKQTHQNRYIPMTSW